MTDYADAMPHGQLEQAFENIHFVTGTVRPNFEGKPWQFSRNMTVVREGDALTLINAVRLDDAGLKKLGELGKVTNVVKIGAFHGMDDRFYVDTFGAKQWTLKGLQNEGGQATDHELSVGGDMPFPGASLFLFETSKMPEALLHIERAGGVLVSCDSLQNWVEVDQFFSKESGELMTQMGFIKPANVGPGWRRFCEPQASDFKRLLSLDFAHLLPAHGSILRKEAKSKLAETFAREFSI